MQIILEYDLSEIETVAQQLLDYIKDVSVITFSGSLGAGKTTLVASILKEMGVTKPVVSPTFTYMNVYTLFDGKIIYHFDLYRLDSLESFEQAGFTDYLYQEKSMCFIEWPEIIESLLTYSVAHIKIDFVGLEKRRLTYTEKK